MTRFLCIAAITVATASASFPAVAAENAERPTIEDFAKQAEYKDVSISPQGNYLAVAAPSGNQTGLAILDISEYPEVRAKAGFKMETHEHVSNIYWAHNERVLFTTSRQAGTLNQPRPTGRLYGMDVDGYNKEMLFGSKDIDRVGRGHRIMDMLRDRPEWILINHYAHDRRRPIAAELNIDDGHLRKVDVSPLDNGALLADHNGEIRFAFGTTEENKVELAYKSDKDADWERLQVEMDGRPQVLGFTKDNNDVYVKVTDKSPLGIYRLDPDTGEMSPVVTHPDVEAQNVMMDMDREKIIGATFHDGKPEMQFIDPEEKTSQLQRMIAKSFEGYFARIDSFTRDHSQAIVAVASDRLPTQYYLFDTEEKKVDFLMASRRWIKPQKMSPTEPINFKASDGMEIPGYLTVPEGSRSEDLPMVVMIHGGPHGPRDFWGFHYEVQTLASRGYAVLQINFRGSGGYGHEFEKAGYREWGQRMQDDITDGTRWAIDQGVADPDRICLYGGSYGGYATAMGLIREPKLYECGFAIAGVYSLPLMYEEGDIPQTDRGVNTLEKYIGRDDEYLKANSPVYQAEKIKDPIYLSHGSEDIRAHVDHYHEFVDALNEAGADFETQWVEDEGHGYYEVENRKAYLSELVNFLDQHIGE